MAVGLRVKGGAIGSVDANGNILPAQIIVNADGSAVSADKLTQVVNNTLVDSSGTQVISRTISRYASNAVMNPESVSISNTVKTKNHAVVTYTGDGADNHEIETGISSVDFTQKGNGSGYYNKRVGSGFAVIADDAVDLIDSSNDTSTVDNWTANNDANLSVSDGVLSVNADTTNYPYARSNEILLDANQYYFLSVQDGGVTESTMAVRASTDDTNIGGQWGYTSNNGIGAIFKSPDDGKIVVTLHCNTTGDDDTATFSNLSILPVAGNGKGSCVVNTSKVHIKSRSAATDNMVIDGVRGKTQQLYTNLTIEEGANTTVITEFTNTGVALGTITVTNDADETYILYQTLYTHIKWSMTSHNKYQLEAYNPVTREGMIMYEGSGVGGHEISHSMGVEIDYVNAKNLYSAVDWSGTYFSLGNNGRCHINVDDKFYTNGTEYFMDVSDKTFTVGTQERVNANNTYIAYYKCKSETWTYGTYVGTGASGNKIPTYDVNGKPVKLRDVVIKRIDDVESWATIDTERGSLFADHSVFWLNASAEESTYSTEDWLCELLSSVMHPQGERLNAANGQYLYMGYIDTNATPTPDDSYFQKPIDSSDADATDTTETTADYTVNQIVKDSTTGVMYKVIADSTSGDMLTDTSKFQPMSGLRLANTAMTFTTGKDAYGYMLENKVLDTSLDLSGCPDGIHWIGLREDGSVVWTDKKPMNRLYEKESADDNRMIFDRASGKWFSTTGGELVANGDFINDSNFNAAEDFDWGKWTPETGVSLTVDDGQLKVADDDGEDYPKAIYYTKGEAGAKYRVEFNLSGSNNPRLEVITNVTEFAWGNGHQEVTLPDTDTSFEFINAGSGDMAFQVYSNTTTDGVYAKLDNISVFKVEPTIDQELPAVTWLKYPYMVSSETAVAEIRNYRRNR